MEIVSFVVLHYGDPCVTDRCVQSILRMEQQERIRIVLVDNEIQTPMKARRKFAERYQGRENVTVLQISENGGFSYGNNQGYRYARARQNADFILVLNNDIEFIQPDFLSRMELVYGKYGGHVLGPDIVHRVTGEHQNPMDTRLRTAKEAEYTIRMNRMALKVYPLCYPLLLLNFRLSEHRQTKERLRRTSSFSKTVQGIVPFGACLIFTPQFVRLEEEAFVPETTFYYEEYLLSLRCERKDYQITYTPELQVLHESGEATANSHRNGYERLRFHIKCVAEAAAIYLNEVKEKETAAAGLESMKNRR